jgi:hypothetical protein
MGEESASGGRRHGRRRFFVAGAIGAACAVVVFLSVLLDGSATLFAVGKPSSGLSGELASFYDFQAHSLLELKWTVPSLPLGVEGFAMDDGHYIYFGPWPAVLRMPLLAFTDTFDGRLTQASMLLAFMVTLFFTIRLAWRVRSLALGEVPVQWAEAVAVGAFVFVAGAGSSLVFLGSELVVFHEAIFWGIAWSIGAFELLIAFVLTLRTRYLVLASVCSLLAMFSRAALGLGPLIALAVIFAVVLIGRGRGVFGLAERDKIRRFAIPIAAAGLVPAALYVALNLEKFGTPFSLPFDRQMAAIFSATHRAVLKRNDGSMVGLQFFPTNLLQYFRPDAIRFSGAFPWVTWPQPASVVGAVRFDQVMPASSVSASMPFLTAFGIAGLVALFRRPTAPGRTFAAVRAPVLGAVLASTVTLTFGFIAQRYVADFVPLVVLLAVPGLYLLISWSATRPRATIVRVIWAGAAVLAVASVWISAGLAVVWQRGGDPVVLQGTAFPKPGALGTVFVLGDCEGLYRSSGSEWRALEATPSTGRFRFRLVLPGGRTSGREPLVVSGERGRGQYVFVDYLPENQFVFGTLLQGHGKPVLGMTITRDPGREYFLDITIDPQVPHVAARLNGLLVMEETPTSPGVVRRVRDTTIGRNDIGGPMARSFSGELDLLPFATPDCRKYAQIATAAR